MFFRKKKKIHPTLTSVHLTCPNTLTATHAYSETQKNADKTHIQTQKHTQRHTLTDRQTQTDKHTGPKGFLIESSLLLPAEGSAGTDAGGSVWLSVWPSV